VKKEEGMAKRKRGKLSKKPERKYRIGVWRGGGVGDGGVAAAGVLFGGNLKLKAGWQKNSAEAKKAKMKT
jgi:hypothetical protein